MSDLRDLFCRNLKFFRKSRDFTQRSLSLRCGFAHSYVGQLERGKKDPSFESLLKLADELDVSVVDFFRADGDVSYNLKQALLTLSENRGEVLQSLSVLASQVDSMLRMAGVLDPQGRIVDYNRTVYELIHEEEDELLGRELWELRFFGDSEETREWVRDRIRLIQEEPGIYRRRFTFITNQDQSFKIEGALTPIKVDASDEYFILAEGHRIADIREESREDASPGE